MISEFNKIVTLSEKNKVKIEATVLQDLLLIETPTNCYTIQNDNIHFLVKDIALQREEKVVSMLHAILKLNEWIAIENNNINYAIKENRINNLKLNLTFTI